MTKILVTKPNVLNRTDKAKLRKAGIVHVTAENPDDVRFIEPSMPSVAGNDLLYAAINALSIRGASNDLREQFVKVLASIATPTMVWLRESKLCSVQF